jgi:predicted CXXCH cytochrome family protein
MSGAQCARCHEAQAGFSHPVDIVPTMAVPAMLPLENGKVTCVTCHDNTLEAHSRDRTATASGGHAEALLRNGLDATVLCTQCHVVTGITRKAMHPIGVGRAHLLWARATLTNGQLAAGSKAAVRPASLGVADASLAAATNDGSRTCAGCHDGTVATDALGSGSRGMVGFSLRGTVEGGHLFAISYDRPRGRNRSLKPANMLDPRIRLFNGQVGCESCHSPYSTQPKLLVMSNESSRLCLSCHETQ